MRVIKISIVLGIMSFFLLSCSSVSAQKTYAPLDLGRMIDKTVPKHSVMKHDNYYVWGASMVRSADGKCHLFYARWPKESGWRAWLKESEIAYATADSPDGPYKFERVVLRGRGERYWDEEAAHNPHIKKFGDKYYLYYIAHRKVDLGLSDWLNHIFTQRIGVAVADNPSGPWTRLPEPLIDHQEGKAAHGYMVNPSICERPEGGYLMMFKARRPNSEKTGKFDPIHCIATSDSPTGPFVIAEKPILAEAAAEDPYVWYQNDRYYSIVKDHNGKYTGERSLALFESFNGFDWKPSKYIMVSKLVINWEDGSTSLLKNLERPQIWFDENGQPAMLFCACKLKKTENQEEGLTFNVHISLKKEE